MRTFLIKLAAIVVLGAALVCIGQAMHLEREAWRFRALAYRNFLPDAERLVAEGRYSEARALLDFVLEHPELPRQQEAAKLRAAVQAEMDAWIAKVRRLGRGALTGRGQNTEEIIGAIGADMFIIGDIRDIAVQSWRYVRGNETDPVVAALSVIGLATTAAPATDWVPSFLKLARKTGAMTREFGDTLLNAARQIRRAEAKIKATECLKDTHSLVKRLGPSETLSVMRIVRTQDDLKAAARLAQASPKGAYATLAMGGRNALRILEREGVEQGAQIAVEAAKRGPRGVAVAAQLNPRLFRAHFCVGGGKALWKGNLREAATLALSRLGRAQLAGLGVAAALALAGALTWTAAPIVRRLLRQRSKAETPRT